MKNIIKSCLAGGSISLGLFICLTTTNKTNNPLYGAITFYLGLFLVLIFQLNLFTGQTYTKANLPFSKYILTLIKTYIGNIIGSIITTTLLFQILKPDVTNIITTKLSMNPVQLLISGLFCNILVCGSIYCYKNKTVLASMFLIMCFILGGFNHCIADISYFTLAILNKIDIQKSQLLIYFLMVTIGNILGGRLIYKIERSNQNK